MSAPPPQLQRVTHEPPWKDIAATIGITMLSGVLSAYFDLNEALFAQTRRWEYFQLDELPIGMLVFAICLIWMSWRRYQHARRELYARQAAEIRLAGVLAENRKLAQERVRIVEFERKHLARELHDELGQYLNAIKLDAVSTGDGGIYDAAFLKKASDAIIHSVDHVQNAVSEMIRRLRPVGLDELGLVAAIENCIDHWRQRLPKTQFSLSVSGHFDLVSESVTLTVYRLIQEGLTNIHKHSTAQRVEIKLERHVSLESGTDEVFLAVADDGCGMEPSDNMSGFGLMGMRERVEISGGTFILESTPARGLNFKARLPANGSAND